MIRFEDISAYPRIEGNDYGDRLIFQTPEWIEFIKKTQDVKPIILHIYRNSEEIGFFTGFLFKKMGVRIVGSPFRGWTTLYMGFNIKNTANIDRASLIKPLWRFLQKKYRCIYAEIVDRYISIDDAYKYNLRFAVQESYGIDLDQCQENILKGFTKKCRKHIRQFENSNSRIESVEPTDEFAELFYEQLKLVFGYQCLAPSYDVIRVKALLSELKKENRVLCLKAFDPEGKCRGTSISFGYYNTCYAWASTSVREGKDYCQSEGLRWHAIKYWTQKGCAYYDLAGVRLYKEQFNPYLIKVPRIILAKFSGLILLRDLAEKFYWIINSARCKIHKSKKY